MAELTREAVAIAYHRAHCLNADRATCTAVDQEDRDYADLFIDEVLPLIPDPKPNGQCCPCFMAACLVDGPLACDSSGLPPDHKGRCDCDHSEVKS